MCTYVFIFFFQENETPDNSSFIRDSALPSASVNIPDFHEQSSNIVNSNASFHTTCSKESPPIHDQSFHRGNKSSLIKGKSLSSAVNDSMSKPLAAENSFADKKSVSK